MYMKRIFTLTIAMLFIASGLIGQVDQDTVVQFSGRVVASDGDDLIPLPYTNIGILGTSRGTNADLDGFFSFVAVKGETVRFTRILCSDHVRR